MLTSIVFWAQVLGTAADVALLARILSLRLQRTYLFITLACVVTVIFDVSDLWLGASDQITRNRIFLYSRFLYVFLFPMTAFEVFEEMKTRIGKLRRLAIQRLASGMVFTILLSVVLLAFLDVDSEGGEPVLITTLAIVLWAGASTASLSFLITMHRVLRTQPIEMPRNTSVWLFFYELSFGAEVLSCFLMLILPLVRVPALGDSLDVALVGFGVAITGWCVVKLRRVPGEDMGAASQNAIG